MTDQERILEEIKQIRELLVGDKLRGIPGIADVLDTHRKDIYGDVATRHIGLKQGQETNNTRISSLESDRIKIIAYCVAVSFSVGLVWIAVKEWILK